MVLLGILKENASQNAAPLVFDPKGRYKSPRLWLRPAVELRKLSLKHHDRVSTLETGLKTMISEVRSLGRGLLKKKCHEMPHEDRFKDEI